MSTSQPAGLTLREAADVLSDLRRIDVERFNRANPDRRLRYRRVTPSQVRAILVLGTNARAREPRRKGETRLLSAVDVAMIRLNLRLRDEGISPIVARIVLAHVEQDLIPPMVHGVPIALKVIGVRGVLANARQPRHADAVAWVDTRDVWAGIEGAIETTRRAEPNVWQWKVKPSVAVDATAQRS